MYKLCRLTLTPVDEIVLSLHSIVVLSTYTRI